MKNLINSPSIQPRKTTLRNGVFSILQKNKVFFLFLFFFESFYALASPICIFRPQTPTETFFYIDDLIRKASWFKKNGYQVVLPQYPAITNLYENSHEISEEQKKDLEELIYQIYDSRLFDSALHHLQKAEPLLQKAYEKLSILEKNWGFKLQEKYEVILTLYGPGGEAKNGIISLFTTPQGYFKRKMGYEVLLHEIVHIGIEECIVKKYRLTHWEKERLVDLICRDYLQDIMPEYKMQASGDQRIDSFTTLDHIVCDLPNAMEEYTKFYPRTLKEKDLQ